MAAESDVVAWIQTGDVVDWDLRIQSFQGLDAIGVARPEPLPICWQQNLRDVLTRLEGQAGLVWVRAREDGETSTWVGPKLVSVPEPDAQTMTAFGLVLLVAMQTRRRTARRRMRSA